MGRSFESIIETISIQFTKAWNEWDLEKLKTFLHNDVYISSPQIAKIYPENTKSEIIGKDALMNYLIKLFKIQHKFKVTQISITIEDKIITTVNLVEGTSIKIQEKIVLDSYGKIIELYYVYIDN